MTTTLDDLTQEHLDQLTTLVEHFRPAMILEGSRRYSLQPDLAEDCVQTTYLKVARNILKGDLNDHGNLRGYVWKSFYRACLDQLHLQSHFRSCSFSEDDSPLPSREQTPPAAMTTQENLAKIQQATAVLPSLYQDVFRLRTFEHLRYDLIAQRLGLAKNTVSIRLHRARTFLQRHLENLFRF
ncbi:MAG: sigma-70 family RNA polymerase sigma factor [Candidatus Woesearchaeota archaeon]|nr:sigma-70 family RNA polymerase sigma factor [Candidatus Woesearchaeota archaeon]